MVDPGGRLVGVIQLDDVRPYMFRTDLYQALIALDVMNRQPASVERDAEMAQVMHLFEKHRVWNLPVTDKGRYIGFVSQSRILGDYRRTLVRQEARHSPEHGCDMTEAADRAEPKPANDL